MRADPPRPKLVTVLETADVDALVRFLADEIGLRVDRVSPADSPAEVTMSGLGATVLVRRSAIYGPAHLLIEIDGDELPSSLPRRAPNGTVIETRRRSAEVHVPSARPELSIVRARDDVSSGTGRAGMQYRDLLPGRWGGRFVASRIRIPGGGEVADWVHHHRIRFQMIFCAAGWVDVVYEDQGGPFRLEAGDCVLQPPGIRHRVLRSSPGLEVIEIGCPAVHDTISDHELRLPTASVRPGRDFGGQRFVRHVAVGAATGEWLVPGLVARDTGIAAATDGLAGAVVVTAAGGPGQPRWLTYDDELVFDVVLAGSADLVVHATGDDGESRHERLERGDAVALPPGARWCWNGWSDEFQLLEVALGADAVRSA
jgi:mannose-6-phosphate isomerase-like protein (cupin superfamily)